MHSEKGFLRYDEKQNSIILTLMHGMGEKYTTQANGQVETQPIVFENTAVSLPLNNLLGSSTFVKRLGYMTLTELLQQRRQAIKNNKIIINLEIQKHVVMSFAILSLVLIAIPLGIKLSRAETSANIVLAVALALSFYFIVMAISWLESKPYLRPDLLVWCPNILFQGLGYKLIRKTLQH